MVLLGIVSSIISAFPQKASVQGLPGINQKEPYCTGIILC